MIFFFQPGNYFQKNVHFFSCWKFFFTMEKYQWKLKLEIYLSAILKKKMSSLIKFSFFLIENSTFFLTNWINRISIFIAIQIRNRISSWNLWYNTYLKIGKQFHYHILTMIHTKFTFGHFSLFSTLSLLLTE